MPTDFIKSSFSTIATDPLRNFKFACYIYHLGSVGWVWTAGGFSSLSGLSVTTDSIPYRNGSYNTTVQQIPGQTSFTPITLQRGVIMGTNQHWAWMREIFSTIAGGGNATAGNNYRAPLTIIDVMDHPVTAEKDNKGRDAPTPVKLRFGVHNAWISSLSYSDMNAGDHGLLVEQMTLVHEGFTMGWASGAGGATVQPDNILAF